MKTIRNYRLFLGLAILWLSLGNLWSQSVEETKTIQKTYAIYPTARIEVSNKYGNVHINTWEKDSVKINITYTISAKDKKRYDKAAESIDFEFIETSHYIIARTVFLNSGKDLIRDLSAAISSSPGSSINVNYELFVPRQARLSINNKYGDVYTEDLSGDVTFDLGYGIFKAHDFKGHANLVLNNCKATINSLSVGIVTLDYSELALTKAGSIKLNSKASKTNIHHIDAITLDGKSDEISMDHCGKANVTGNFSKFTISNLDGDFNANTKYGTLNLYFAKNFAGSVSLNTKYTDITLRVFEAKTRLKTEIRHQRSKLAYPTSFVNLTEEKISGNDVIYHSSGSIGNGPQNASNLTINMESGELTIFSR